MRKGQELAVITAGTNVGRCTFLYSIKQTPRGSVVVLGDRIISDYEMPTAIAQQTADWLNDRKKHAC